MIQLTTPGGPMKRLLAPITARMLALGFAACVSLIACMNQDSPTSDQTGSQSQTTTTTTNTPTTPTQTPTLQPGQLQLVSEGASAGLAKTSTDSVKGLAKVSRTSDSSVTYTFDLDTAKASVQTFFLLENIGDEDVQNIVLTTNNPSFYFSPSTIALLHPSKSLAVQQIITLNVIHGTPLNGVGTAPLLPAGVNIATATLTATTTDAHSDTLTLSQSAQLKIFAQVMDVQAYDDSTPLDLSQPSGSMKGPGVPVQDWIPYYAITSGICKLVNTGNVPIIMREWSGTEGTDVVTLADSTIVAPGGTYLPTVYHPTLDYGSLQLDGQGVVSNPAKLLAVSDGRIFLRFQLPILPPPIP